MNKRAFSLDALRGYAIITMVLSGTIASGVLPGWMYHAQVGPRSNFAFDPSFYGITWVDLVFPFFLFAMGAAFPFSIGNKLENSVGLYITWIPVNFLCYFYPAYVSLGNIFSSRCAVVVVGSIGICSYVSHVYENSG